MRNSNAECWFDNNQSVCHYTPTSLWANVATTLGEVGWAGEIGLLILVNPHRISKAFLDNASCWLPKWLFICENVVEGLGNGP